MSDIVSDAVKLVSFVAYPGPDTLDPLDRKMIKSRWGVGREMALE